MKIKASDPSYFPDTWEQFISLPWAEHGRRLPVGHPSLTGGTHFTGYVATSALLVDSDTPGTLAPLTLRQYLTSEGFAKTFNPAENHLI